MTASIVNLRQARKAKARAEREKQAAQNRTIYGRSKNERETDQAANRHAESRLDGALRTGPGHGIDTEPDK